MIPDRDGPGDPLVRLREGDSAPFETFVREHARLFYAFFRRQGAGLHRAEDLTQEVFLKLFHHAARYRPEERFTAFCFRVARNVWIDDRRRAAARPPSVSGLEGGEEPLGDPGTPLTASAPGSGTAERDPALSAMLREEDGRLRAALKALPETHRVVFELGAMQELSYAEVASILEIPVGTVKSRMFHAIRKLRGMLDPGEGAA